MCAMSWFATFGYILGHVMGRRRIHDPGAEYLSVGGHGARERIRGRIAEHADPYPLTASIGVATHVGGDDGARRRRGAHARGR